MLQVKKVSYAFGKMQRESGVLPWKMLGSHWGLCILGNISLFSSFWRFQCFAWVTVNENTVPCV